MPLRVRTHGDSGPPVVVLHGGPGAPGSAVGLARGLAGDFLVLEPHQRGSGGEPLTVARHVADLADLLAERLPGRRPALVGHSWGAMLAVAFAAEHPDAVAGVALVGSGTFDPVARAQLLARREARTTPSLRAALEALDRAALPPDERLARRAALQATIHAVDPLPEEGDAEPVDARANQETWQDMLRLQAAGVYPAALSRVRCPVLMLHGGEDPHPGPAIRDGLRPHVPHLVYREFTRCGHEPWRERHARAAFFEALRGWLREVLR